MGIASITMFFVRPQAPDFSQAPDMMHCPGNNHPGSTLSLSLGISNKAACLGSPRRTLKEGGRNVVCRTKTISRPSAFLRTVSQVRRGAHLGSPAATNSSSTAAESCQWLQSFSAFNCSSGSLRRALRFGSVVYPQGCVLFLPPACPREASFVVRRSGTLRTRHSLGSCSASRVETEEQVGTDCLA